jgi:hypothetical protein
MNRKVKAKPYDFQKDYKKLPVKKRVGLIKIARKLLNQQKEDAVILADSTKPKKKKGIV